MTKQVTLKAHKRNESGKSEARRLRREGGVPATLYGHGFEPESLQVDGRELSLLLGRISAGSTLIDLKVGGGPARKVLIREVQRHPWRPSILHVDFFRIKVDEEIKVAVPLQLTGEAVGVKTDGGILQQHRYEIQISCLPTEIPEGFEIDVSELSIGDSLQVSDVDVGEVTMLEDPEALVCAVTPPTVLRIEEELEEELEEEFEPELVGEAEAAEEAETEAEAEES